MACVTIALLEKEGVTIAETILPPKNHSKEVSKTVSAKEVTLASTATVSKSVITITSPPRTTITSPPRTTTSTGLIKKNEHRIVVYSQEDDKKVKKLVYKAMEGSSENDQRNTIYGYALDLISLVCNNSYIGTIVDNPPHRILDTPQFGYTVETEPEKERLMRLQVHVTVLLPNVYY